MAMVMVRCPNTKAGNIHRHRDGPRSIPQQTGVLPLYILSTLPQQSRMVRKGCIGLRLQLSRTLRWAGA